MKIFTRLNVCHVVCGTASKITLTLLAFAKEKKNVMGMNCFFSLFVLRH